MLARSLVLALGLAAVPVAAEAAAPRAAETVDQIARPSRVAAFGDTAVWSAYDPATKRYSLRAQVGDAAPADLAVAPRSVPFDASVGVAPKDGTPATFVLYSRCATEPKLDQRSLPRWTTAHGCDVYRYDLRAGHEERLGGVSTSDASEFLPTISGPNIAFVRVYDHRRGRRGTLPYLYVRPSAGGRSARLPGGPRGDDDAPGPTSMSLYGHRLAFSWQYRHGKQGIRSALRVDTFTGDSAGLRREHHQVVDQGASGTALSTDELLGASFAGGGRLYWAQTCAGDTAGCNAREHLYRLGLHRDVDRAAAPRYLLGHAYSDRGVYVVRSLYGLQAQFANPCIKPQFTSEQGLCQVERLAQPGYS